MKPDQVWQAALGELQLQMTRATFDTWVKNTSVISYEDGTFLIGVHNGYAKDWLENRLLTIIKRTVAGIVGHAVELKFIVWAQEHTLDEEMPLAQALRQSLSRAKPSDSEQAGSGQREHSQTQTSATTMLNPRYTFDTFVVGSNNRLAHAASLAVAENPAGAYNPLFLYGGVGLGKTHLLHAIGNFCARHLQRVLYVSSETFTNDLINSIRTQTTGNFRDKYRKVDVLLIDDIQFIAGKESTQEEFFHTFNSLHAANKQIVISSDRPPRAIPTLEERLRSRFEGGLIADLQLPDLETRAAILRFKATAQSLSVPDEVLDLIAQRVQSNIRELEGALNRVLAYADLMHVFPTIEVAKTALDGVLTRTVSITPDEIVETVASFYNLPPEELKGRGRRKEVVLPRQLAMYLAREETDASLPEIGRVLGGRDHTTVLYGYEKISTLIEEDDGLRRQIISIKDRLYHNSH
ncbi:MAG: chromosomal replication initiator protein DnaA [Chloroflexi bacterium]|nr:MAG: chromosomal replication initiator protein DnaA [Chloroflexota bacterium]